MQTVSTVNQ